MSTATWQGEFRPSGRHQEAHIPRPQGLELFSIDFKSALSLGLATGADTIRDALRLLPSGLGAYGSYVDNFEGFFELLGMTTKLGKGAVYYSYTIFGNRAHFADVEPGAMSASHAAAWIHDGHGIPLPGHNVPGAYTSSGNADTLFDALGLGHLPHSQLPTEFIYQSAHYGAGPHICGPATCGFRQAHSTQWDDKGPNDENYDRQLWLPGVLHPTITPTPTPEDLTMVAAAELNGVPHVFYEDKNGDVFYTYQPQDAKTPGPDRAWLGGKQGQAVAAFSPFAKAPK